MARAITGDELTLLRSDGQWSELYMAVLKPNTVYTARLNGAPVSNDQVYEITYDGGSGTLADVKAGMTLLVGTTAGARDLGICRIRTAPEADTFFIGEISEIVWADNCYLTVTDDFDLWARHLHVDTGGTLLMDVNIGYTDEHEVFDPVPVLGTHACVWLTGATVDVDFDASDSWVFDSTITGYAWDAPGCASIADDDTATPVITYDTAGIYRVLCTVEAATGRTMMGARYVFVFDDDNPPATVFQIANCEGSVDAGGWMMDVTMQAEASLTDLREGTLVVLFAKDYFEGTEQSIGPVENRENILMVGRVGSSESIRWDPIAGQVHFNVYGPQWWMNKIKISACQLDFTAAAPDDWSQVKNLSVDRALFHLLHYRSTATIVMDFYPTLDTCYDNKISSLGTTLWAQLVEFAGLKLMAHVLCDRLGRFFAQIDPQMVPEADRSALPVVMTVTEDDWQDVIEFERETVHETGQVNISTRVVNSIGTSATVYSLSPGHIPRRYGDWEINDGMLAASQEASNEKAGLLLGWKNNEFPNIPLKLAQNNRFVDIAPNQYLDITIDAADTPRGVGYDGNIIPRRVALRYNAESRDLTVDVNCEGETFEQPSCNGDIPGSSDVDLSVPPLPPLPPLPDFPILIPGTPTPTSGGPKRVLFLDANKGLIYTENFDAALPTYVPVNAGLSTIPYPTGSGGIVGKAQYELIHRFFVTPNGAVFVWRMDTVQADEFPGGGATTGLTDYFMLMRAPSVGGTFVPVYSRETVSPSDYPPGSDSIGLLAVGFNPLVPESYAFTSKDSPGGVTPVFRGHLGSGTSFSTGATGVYGTGAGSNAGGGLSYGLGKWLLTGLNRYQLLSPDMSTILESHPSPAGGVSLASEIWQNSIVRVSTSGKVYVPASGDPSSRILATAENNDVSTLTFLSDSTFGFTGFACDPTGQYMMGRYGGFLGRGFSPDYGATWAGMGSLPAANYYFAYAGQGERVPRFIAMGGVIRLTEDLGTTWINKESASLLAIAPFPDLVGAQVLEY